MSRRPPLLFLPTASLLVLASVPSPLAAQAFTPPRGVGSLTLGWQWIDNTGHRLTDGFLVARGQSVDTSVLAELDYALTDRLAVALGIPYVFAKYTGKNAPISGLPRDTCHCWQSSFQDFSLAARYRLGNDTRAVTPVVRYIQPSHDYAFRGEAVVGRDLKELQVGLLAGTRLGFLPPATLQAGYTYAFVETPVEDVPIDRSNGFVDAGYAANRRLYVHASGYWQYTHGGLRIGSDTGNPFPTPGEFNTPERLAQRDRLGRTHFWQLGGGVTYTAGPMDVFVSFTKYIWGRGAHNGQLYNVGASWYFGLPR